MAHTADSSGKAGNARDAGKTLSSEARAVHDAALIVDLHADTPKLMARGYDISRRHEPKGPLTRLAGQVDLPRMREGNLRAQFFGLWTFPFPRRGCARDVHRQLDALETAAVDFPSEFVLACDAEEIHAAVRTERQVGLRGIEGGQALEGKIENLEEFARRGVRYLGLLHLSPNDLGRPTYGVGRDETLGLTAFGVEVVDSCARLGVIVDLAHINRKGFFEVVERRPGPLLVSHAGVAGVTAHRRNIADDQVRAVADSGGVVGIIFAPQFVGKNLEAVVDHIVHAIRVGGEDSVGLGSDWDGFIRPCAGLEDPGKLPHLTEALLRRGLTPETLHKLLGQNVLRVLGAVPMKTELSPPRGQKSPVKDPPPPAH